MGFHDFLNFGIFSGFSENPRDLWQIFGIQDFFESRDFYPRDFHPWDTRFFSPVIFIPGIRDLP